jgi:hypothetical protein
MRSFWMLAASSWEGRSNRPLAEWYLRRQPLAFGPLTRAGAERARRRGGEAARRLGLALRGLAAMPAFPAGGASSSPPGRRVPPGRGAARMAGPVWECLRTARSLRRLQGLTADLLGATERAARVGEAARSMEAAAAGHLAALGGSRLPAGLGRLVDRWRARGR